MLPDRKAEIDHFQPNTTYKLDRIDRLASTAWRIRRTEPTETALLYQEIDIRKPDIEKASNPLTARASGRLASRASTNCNAISNLDLRRARLARQYKRLVSLYEKGEIDERTHHCGAERLVPRLRPFPEARETVDQVLPNTASAGPHEHRSLLSLRQ